MVLDILEQVCGCGYVYRSHVFTVQGSFVSPSRTHVLDVLGTQHLKGCPGKLHPLIRALSATRVHIHLPRPSRRRLACLYGFIGGRAPLALHEQHGSTPFPGPQRTGCSRLAWQRYVFTSHLFATVFSSRDHDCLLSLVPAPPSSAEDTPSRAPGRSSSTAKWKRPWAWQRLRSGGPTSRYPPSLSIHFSSGYGFPWLEALSR